jgi:hypothetical protein
MARRRGCSIRQRTTAPDESSNPWPPDAASAPTYQPLPVVRPTPPHPRSAGSQPPTCRDAPRRRALSGWIPLFLPFRHRPGLTAPVIEPSASARWMSSCPSSALSAKVSASQVSRSGSNSPIGQSPHGPASQPGLAGPVSGPETPLMESWGMVPFKVPTLGQPGS